MNMDKPEFKHFYGIGLHLTVEKLDNDGELHTFMEELTNQDAIDFIHYHIEMTTPVFGEWNYSKHLK